MVDERLTMVGAYIPSLLSHDGEVTFYSEEKIPEEDPRVFLFGGLVFCAGRNLGSATGQRFL